MVFKLSQKEDENKMRMKKESEVVIHGLAVSLTIRTRAAGELERVTLKNRKWEQRLD